MYLDQKNSIKSVQQIIRQKLSKDIIDAYQFAKIIHKKRKRHSGKPFVHHVVSTANNILTWLNTSKLTNRHEELIIAALLHDSIEYEGVDPKIIEDKFGIKIRKLVEGVNEFRSHGSEKRRIENLRYIAQKGGVDPRVFVIKLADRLHNMRTHKYLPKEKHIPKATETLNVYAQLAESMGLWQVKKELEDLCFSYINPKKYKGTKNVLSNDPRLNKKFQKNIVKKLINIFAKSNIKTDILIVENGIYKIFEKKESALTTGSESIKGFSHISDVVSFKVVTRSENTNGLYNLMGLLHTSPDFSELVDIGEINDYIAKPQPNKYSAIQTTINLPEGNIEIVFTTNERNEFNNYGIMTYIKNDDKKYLEYKRNIIFDENDTAWFLPLNATYLDYVYMKGIGPEAKYVMVNGKKKNLTSKVKNSSIVKTIIRKKGKPKVDNNLLKYCLPETKPLIERQINLIERKNLAKKGKIIMEKILVPRGLLNIFDYKEIVNTLTYYCVAEDLYDLYYKIAVGNISLDTISKFLDLLRVTKENLGFCTIRVSGPDKPGILTDISKILNSYNANILQVDLTSLKKKKRDYFVMRILTKGITIGEEKTIKQDLIKLKHFDKVEVV